MVNITGCLRTLSCINIYSHQQTLEIVFYVLKTAEHNFILADCKCLPELLQQMLHFFFKDATNVSSVYALRACQGVHHEKHS